MKNLLTILFCYLVFIFISRDKLNFIFKKKKVSKPFLKTRCLLMIYDYFIIVLIEKFSFEITRLKSIRKLRNRNLNKYLQQIFYQAKFQINKFKIEIFYLFFKFDLN